MARYEYYQQVTSAQKVVVDADSVEDAENKIATILLYLPYNVEEIMGNIEYVEGYDQGAQLCDYDDEDETEIPDNVQRKIDDYNNRNKS